MSTDSQEQFPRVTGVECKAAIGKLLAMAFVFVLMGLIGSFMIYLWFYQVELPGGFVLRVKALYVGVLGVLVSLCCVPVVAYWITSAKRLVISETCVQLCSGDRVVIHISYHNISESSTNGVSEFGLVSLKLRNPRDPTTLVPYRYEYSYNINAVVYGKPGAVISAALTERLEEFRAGGGGGGGGGKTGSGAGA